MDRQYQCAGFADFQALTNRDAGRFKHVDLLEQVWQRQYDTVSDQAVDIVPQNAGRDQVEHRFLTVNDKGMTGVVSSLKSNDRIGFFGKPIDQFSFTFIPPLGSDDNDILAHQYFPTSESEFRVHSRGVAGRPRAITQAVSNRPLLESRPDFYRPNLFSV